MNNLLYPVVNDFRDCANLNGLWEFDVHSPQDGELGRIIAVPGSWNEQFVDLHDYHGTGWYHREFFVTDKRQDKQYLLRIGAACNHCQAWVNGQSVGSHRLGYLPAVFDVTEMLQKGNNEFLIAIDSILSDKTLPTSAFDRGHWAGTEMAADYFPYSGLHRDVQLLVVPKNSLANCKIDYVVNGNSATAVLKVWTSGEVEEVCVRLKEGHQTFIEVGASVVTGFGEITFNINSPMLWSPDSPHLYDLEIVCKRRGEVCDIYELQTGIRTIEVTQDHLLLNGQPIFLRGFSRHEDFPIIGRGHNDAVMVRDFELMKWLGANSFRTSHYPYDERQYQLADRLGFLVIGEASAVSLFVPKHGQDADSLINSEINELHKKTIETMIHRDWNHPSVIIWSMANECNGHTPKAFEYFKDIYKFTKSIDNTRPVIHTNIGAWLDNSHEFSDICCINHYDFAYGHKGRDVQEVRDDLKKRILEAKARFGKPVFLSEFGICGIPGFHNFSHQYFTEEGMVEHVFTYLDVAESLDCVIGTHIWLLNDFKAQECSGRPVNNFKGMFDRCRQPKLIAHLLKQRWGKSKA